ncbi:5' nucleotidase family-domain-containing protein [Pelagophyceae sp. CCMP2097]|nr:5' nucleotidase family-domain-containing protein [Pelagophyceae sp. CCMP2097]|mmetsp:Transcript_6228/g.19977  ORF Transcript_6228/g.19977 Transcript_6228/m.19977 type:complete len:622 (+) Transcript_6228:45-1910(+)
MADYGAALRWALLLLGSANALQNSGWQPRAAARLSTAVPRAPALRVAPDLPEFAVVGDENRSVDYLGQPDTGDLRVVGTRPFDDVSGATDGEADSEALQLQGKHEGLQWSRPEQRVFCSRSLNLRAIKAIGYDMDYTIVHYKWRQWEELAYECAKEELLAYGFPVADLRFDDAELVCRGLVLDRELGNFVKIDRHGFVRRGMHGDRRLTNDEVDAAYGRGTVDLRFERYSFLNTLFSVSEGVLYSQLVGKLDSGALYNESSPPFDSEKCASYEDLHRAVTKALSRAHAINSKLKAAVSSDPAKFTQREAKLLRETLDDQRAAGKQLALITNSDWSYTDIMMRYVCGDDNDWRELFDVVIVSARKPQFFTPESLPCYELVFDDDHPDRQPLMREASQLRMGQVYCGGSARLVERLFGATADSLLYVGDHIFTDVNAVKASMRWRTALVVQELEAEIVASQAELAAKREIYGLLKHKDELSCRVNVLRCQVQRWQTKALGRNDMGDVVAATKAEQDEEVAATKAEFEIAELLQKMLALDAQLAPQIRDQGAAFNRHWGYLTRAGFDDKSHLARQIEKYADIYCARVTNLHAYTPYHYFRAAPQVLAHDSAASVDEAQFETDFL